ncbi:4Fe-4S binding protein [Dehalococcoides mccartyi]|jgi:Na+-translocating ferredoxin:NAD+ oxidoreductase RnfG subunit|uniref:FMN-binding domain-containing protein n=2 Tax=Dehalococcoides mccartyi TaxID=61435 RepID=A0A142VC49_9CHLR|nr:4Fe-4S binding protein [Dehalococcoides mccartyi]AII61581.1 transcriptional regulator [Dehalococcoides mccartyi CG5]AMU87384.1 FMN-binding domain-containing protein [Dehalococcoides mccartyi]AQU06525.1 transcriptional regulator [Dehalococcoides mccartyi]AQU07965.1 transcriptional regulator [Dehalococcoides mccartyi]AQX73892.1 transcriptional regulator [Dehalococcoides mccartyi]
MQSSFWKLHGKKALIIFAILTVVIAGVIGKVSASPDVEQYLSKVVPEAASFKKLADRASDDLYLFGALDSDGNQIAFVTSGKGLGYAGPMTVVVAWSNDGVILAMDVPQTNDTPAWYNRLAANDYFSQFIGRSYQDPLQLNEDINAVSGATRSSTGVDTGVREGRLILSEQLGNPYPVPPEPINFGLAEVFFIAGILAVFALRMIPSLRKVHVLRYLSLLVGLAVFGIWLSVPLSLVNFIVFPTGFAPSWQSNMLLYLMVFGIIGAALAFGKNLWCFWMCPFSAIQEGLNFIGGGRTRPITRTQLVMRNTRYVILWLIVVLVLVFQSPSLAVFEPWNTIFSLKGALDQWLLVIATLGVSLFIHDFWCHYLCPVGATMDIILKIRKSTIGLVNKFSGK